MALKQRNYAVEVGSTLQAALQQATNEDIQHVFTLVDAAAPLGTGAPVDLTGMASIKLTVKDASGTQLLQAAGVAVGAPTAGVAGFTVTHAMIAAAAAQAYKADILLIDGAGNQNQVLIPTPFLLLAGIT